MIVSDYAKVEEEERRWHLRHAVWRARKVGAKFKDISHVLGKPHSTVHRMYQEADREACENEPSPMMGELSKVEIVKESQWCAALGIRTQAYRDTIAERDRMQKPWLAAGMSKSVWWRLWQRGQLPE